MEERRKVQKRFSRNGKLMPSVMLLVIFLNSVLLAFNIFCIRLPTYTYSFESCFVDVNNPTSAEIVNLLMTMKDDLRLFVALQWIFFFAYSFTSLTSAALSILGASVTYCGKDLSVMKLLLTAAKSLKRVFVTWFYIKLLDLGYFLLIAFLFPLVLISNSAFTTFAFLIILVTVAVLFRIYLAVVWELGIVVSVLEEKHGIEALGRAAHLIKGSKLRGFFLNLFGTVSRFMLICSAMVGSIAFPENAKVVPFIFLSSVVCLIKMFLLISYTVIYHECEETNGKKLELQESIEYSYIKGTLDEFIPFFKADVLY